MEQVRNARGLVNTQQMVYEDFPPSSDWTQDSNCHVLLIDLPGFKREELKVRVDNFRKVTVSGERHLGENKYSRFKQVYEMPEDSNIDNISGRFDGGLLFIIIPKKKPQAIQQPSAEVQSVNEIEEEEKKDKNPIKEEYDTSNHEKRDEKHNEAKNDDVVKEIHEKRDELQNEELKKADDVQHDDSHDDIENEKTKECEWKGGKGGVAGEARKRMEEDLRKLAERVKNTDELDVLMKTTIGMIRKNKTAIITAVLAFSIGLYISRKLQSGGE